MIIWGDIFVMGEIWRLGMNSCNVYWEGEGIGTRKSSIVIASTNRYIRVNITILEREWNRSQAKSERSHVGKKVERISGSIQRQNPHHHPLHIKETIET